MPAKEILFDASARTHGLVVLAKAVKVTISGSTGGIRYNGVRVALQNAAVASLMLRTGKHGS